jgi:fatty acid desaturase
MAIEQVRVDLPPTDSKLFAYTRWDAVPVLAGFLHLVYYFGLFLLFPRAPLWVMLILGFLYSISISWNINGVSHNFIHNPYFRSTLLNRWFAVLESVVCGFSQTYYDVVHIRHHKGNSDRPDEHGETVDWISIYRHGRDGKAENVWSYTLLSLFRDAGGVAEELKRRGRGEFWWGNVELAAVSVTMIGLTILNWRYMIFYFMPFWYYGHCLSYLNGYYRHYGGNPDKPIAWGVSTYEKLYNWTWFYNGYHAEHHFRPKCHWTRMVALHEQIKDAQEREGVHVIKPPHALGFLERGQPPLERSGRAAETVGARDPVSVS